MKQLTCGLAALLKLLSLPAEKRRDELKDRLSGGGYNIYWSMEKFIPALVKKEMTLDQVGKAIDALKNERERRHNWSGIRSFLTMWRDNPVPFLPTPESVFISEYGMLRVNVRPILAHLQDQKKICVLAWNTLKPHLAPEIARLGVYFMNREFPEFRSQVFDLRARVKYAESASWQESEIRLARELRLTESLWIELNQEADNAGRENKRPGKPGGKGTDIQR
ncbi:MAG: hypothetical protein ACREB6_02075 [Rhodospirillales bacterium]